MQNLDFFFFFCNQEIGYASLPCLHYTFIILFIWKIKSKIYISKEDDFHFVLDSNFFYESNILRALS
uniref:Uncharacterized protein n=1 Tax=Pinctada fucata TaxID=50426 RepID=A0A194ANU5_PINFU